MPMATYVSRRPGKPYRLTVGNAVPSALWPLFATVHSSMRTLTRRLHNLRIFIAAYVAALFGRRSSTQAPERILLVPAGKLGDVVCTTPVMRAIRTHLPHAKLYIREYGGMNAALLADSGLADGYLNAVTTRDYVRELRSLRIDTILLTFPSLKNV